MARNPKIHFQRFEAVSRVIHTINTFFLNNIDDVLQLTKRREASRLEINKHVRISYNGIDLAIRPMSQRSPYDPGILKCHSH